LPFLSSSRWTSSNAALLKEGINEWRNRTALCEDNQCTQEEKHNYNGEQPVTLPNFQEFPEFGYNRLVRHIFLLNIFLRIVPWAASVHAGLPSKKKHFCRV
jgi:hypothetical protein